MAIDNLEDRLKAEVDRHNELVEIRDQATAQAQAAETERQVVRGRIEVLSELTETEPVEELEEGDGQADPSGGPSKKGSSPE